MECKQHSLLTDKLVQQIILLTNGNHARKNDVQLVCANSADTDCRASVTWCFDVHTAKTISAGNSAVPGFHFGYDQASLKNELEELRDEARNNKDLRIDFMSGLVNGEQATPGYSLAKASEARKVHVFDSRSVHVTCSKCRGKGAVPCHSCGCMKDHMCYQCGGMGSAYKTRQTPHGMEQYRASCGSCHGRGRQVCGSCGGRGTEKCTPCNGHGYFTEVYTVAAFATPTWQADLQTDLLQGETLAWLRDAGATRAGKHVAFTMTASGYDEDDNWAIEYVATPPVMQCEIKVKAKKYQVWTVGEGPYCYGAPPDTGRPFKRRDCRYDIAGRPIPGPPGLETL